MAHKNKESIWVGILPDPVTGEMVYYQVTWWSKTPKKMEISKEVWWDIEKGVPAQNQWDYL